MCTCCLCSKSTRPFPWPFSNCPLLSLADNPLLFFCERGLSCKVILILVCDFWVHDVHSVCVCAYVCMCVCVLVCLWVLVFAVACWVLGACALACMRLCNVCICSRGPSGAYVCVRAYVCGRLLAWACGGLCVSVWCVLVRLSPVARIRAKSSAIRTSVASKDVRPKKTKTSSRRKSSRSSNANGTQPVTSRFIPPTHVLCVRSFALLVGDVVCEESEGTMHPEMVVQVGATALLTAGGSCECAPVGAHAKAEYLWRLVGRVDVRPTGPRR
jgi:hypothetical protein